MGSLPRGVIHKPLPPRTPHPTPPPLYTSTASGSSLFLWQSSHLELLNTCQPHCTARPLGLGLGARFPGLHVGPHEAFNAHLLNHGRHDW